jgi:hypothetical protein
LHVVARNLQSHCIQLDHNILKLSLFLGMVEMIILNRYQDISRIVEFAGIQG